MKTHARTAAALSILLLYLLPGQVRAAGACWLDIYDKTDFKGAHVRIDGPADLPNLQRLNGANWSSRIESLVVGEAAQVTVFKQENFREKEEGPAYHGEAIKAWGETPESYGDQEMTFGPGKKEHHLGELHFHQAINSLLVRCQN